jgi:hypothetical protein
VKACPKIIGVYLRIGMGYIFDTGVFEGFSKEVITLG